MKDEIKEILDKITDEDWYEEKDLTGTKWIELKQEETNLLYDYITNLQEYYNDNVNKYEELIVKYSNLQEENNDLKEQVYYQNIWREEYLKRNEKAIEYIKEHIKYECDNVFNGMSFYSHHLYDFKKEDLLNILGGDDNE